MSLYRYRCEQCATTSPVVRTQLAVERERDRHRHRVHGGHIPDGERVQRHTARPGNDRVALVALAVIVLVLVVSALV
jgi:hypothetical protein